MVIVKNEDITWLNRCNITLRSLCRMLCSCSWFNPELICANACQSWSYLKGYWAVFRLFIYCERSPCSAYSRIMLIYRGGTRDVLGNHRNRFSVGWRCGCVWVFVVFWLRRVRFCVSVVPFIGVVLFWGRRVVCLCVFWLCRRWSICRCRFFRVVNSFRGAWVGVY